MIRAIWFVLLAASVAAVAQQAPMAATSAESQPTALLRLDDVLREILARNPALTSAQQTVESRRHAVPQAAALPDPTLTVSWMGNAVPFQTQSGDPSSYRGLSAMQMFPLGGKRALRRELAKTEVSVAETDQTAVQRKLIADAKAAYYDYFYYAKALEITALNKARLQQFAETAEARYSVGKAMQQDVLRAQVELSMLLQRSVGLAQQRETAAARLNTLMGRPVDSPLPPAAEIRPSELPQLSDLMSAAEGGDPMLQKEQRMLERDKTAVTMAQKEFIPDLSVGYMYQQRPGLPDMYGMQFTVNVPVFYKTRQRDAVEQAKLELAAQAKNRESRHLELAYEIKQMHAMAKSAEQMIDLYDKAILPQAELALESARSSYSVGNADLLSVITNFSIIYGYQLDYYRQLADHETAIARIAAITGDLPATVTKEAK